MGDLTADGFPDLRRRTGGIVSSDALSVTTLRLDSLGLFPASTDRHI
jgi:hypothetical protein